jgi:hypothetical protein
VAAGDAEPHNMCMSNGECGNTTACTNKQKCEQIAAGTKCGKDPSCSGGTQTSGRTCDGSGTCQDPTVTGCGQYVCGATTCKIMCMTEADCVGGDYCDGNGKCQPKKGPGKGCSATDECAAGVCGAQNVCCNVTCDGTCMTCKDSSAPGTCLPDTTSPGCVVTPPADGGTTMSI